MDKGFVKTYREMLEWGWFTDPNTAHLYMTLLLKANIKDNHWHGEKVPKGALITSLNNLSCASGLSTQEVRTSLEKLKSTNDIIVEPCKKWTKITVVGWLKYNDCVEMTMLNQHTEQHTEQQSSNTQATTTKESKKVRNSSSKGLCPTTTQLLTICSSLGLKRVNVEKFYETYKGKKIEIEKTLKWWDENERDTTDGTTTNIIYPMVRLD